MIKKMFVMMGLFVGIINSVYAESVQCTQTCDADHDGQKVYCDKKLYTCKSGDWEYFDIDAEGANLCEYSYSDRTWFIIDHRGEYSYDNYSDVYMLRSELSVLPSNSFIDAATSFCIGCATNYYPAYDDASDSEWYSCTGKEEALCLSHELHGQTTWMGAGEGCKCVSSDKVWNNNTHTCDDAVVEEPAQVEPTPSDPQCGVVCNAGNMDKTIFCDGELYGCTLNEQENVYKWKDVQCPNDLCAYTAYNQRDTSVFTKKIFESGLEAVYGKPAIANGTVASCDDICRGCTDFSDGNGNCFAIKAQAECEWYAEQESVNVKWENDKCMCQASHREWEDYSCPEDGLIAFNEPATGTTCDLSCNEPGDVYYCDGIIYECQNRADDIIPVDISSSGESDMRHVGLSYCEYTDPGTMKEVKQDVGHIDVLPTFALYGTKPLTVGEKLDLWDVCIGCVAGYYYNGTVGEACEDQDAAWCNWYAYKEEKEPEHDVQYDIATNQCKCIGNDDGKTWDTVDHICKDAKDVKTGQTDANNTDTVNEAVKNVTSFFNDVEKNKTVWRTEDGKFNTARLASDAIAGTVLGTVGGVVSAKVIKKKQLEKGYDVLNCSVGGQKMADWGDTFNVDLRR